MGAPGARRVADASSGIVATVLLDEGGSGEEPSLHHSSRLLWALPTFLCLLVALVCVWHWQRWRQALWRRKRDVEFLLSETDRDVEECQMTEQTKR